MNVLDLNRERQGEESKPYEDNINERIWQEQRKTGRGEQDREGTDVNVRTQDRGDPTDSGRLN